MNINIRPATEQDIPALCEIWKACFSDSDEYLKQFYKENFGYAEILILTVNEEPACMVHIFDAEFIDGNTSRSAKYKYAGGTLPKFRSKGYFRILMNYVIERARKSGDILLYKPATRALGDLFITLGAEHDTDFKIFTAEPKEKIPLSVHDLNSYEYNRLRNETFSSIPYVKWPDRYVDWCIKDNEFFGGRTLGFEYDGNEHFLMAYPEDKTLIVTETSLSPAQLKKLGGGICDIFGSELIKAYMPERFCSEGESVIATVILNAPVKHTYANLLLI